MKASAVWRALRPHHWVKNLLLFLVPLTAHQMIGYRTIVGFVSFCALASAVYLFNDVQDAASDRTHPEKRSRPIAAGELSRGLAWALVALLVVVGLSVALSIGRTFVVFACGYLVLNIVYTLLLKRLVIIDVLCLATFYVVRIFAGGAIVDIRTGEWFVAFCLFGFLSLAFLKRYVELVDTFAARDAAIVGRSYRPEDMSVMQAAGIFSGMASVLVLCLYINSDEVRATYANKDYIWLIAPLVLYWITRAWFIAGRGEMHHDPVSFAMRDVVSYVVGILIAVIAVVAAG